MTSRLLTAVGAFAAACAISVPACAAATSTPSSPSRPSTATCTGAGDLRLHLPNTRGSKIAGITYYTLDFTNTSSSTCSVSGYPYVSMITRHGGQLGSAAGHGLMTIAPLVVLAPGATAHTTLAYYGGRVSSRRGCGPVATAYQLRVYVAGQKRALYSSMGLHSCSHAGQVYLTVTQPFKRGS
jgi:hypothetical protein